MNQQQSKGESVDFQKKIKLSSAICKVISKQGDQIATYLSHFYENNLSFEKKYHQTSRLSRYNTLLYNFSKYKDKYTDNDLIPYYNLMYSFVTKTVYILDEKKKDKKQFKSYRLMTATYFWIANNLNDSIISAKAAQLVVYLLDYLLNNENLPIQRTSEFLLNIKTSPFFESLQLTGTDQQIANEMMQDAIYLQQQDVAISILKKVNKKDLFKKLIKYSKDLIRLADLALKMLKKTEDQPKFQFFENVFVENVNLKIPQVRYDIVKILSRFLQSNQFQLIGINKFKRIIHQINSNLYPLDADFQQKLTVKQSDRLQQLISLFENDKRPSFLLFHQIMKLKNENIPKSKLVEFFKLQRITNRNGIILALYISQQKNNITSQLLKKYKQIKQPSVQQKLIYLQILHFSLQQTSKLEIFTSIKAQMPGISLNYDCNFSFLPLKSLLKAKDAKGKINSFQKSIILQLLNQIQNDSDRICKIKIDLYSYIKESVPPFLVNIDSVMNFPEKNISQIFKQLPNLGEELLEMVLIFVNDQFEQNQVKLQNTSDIDFVIQKYEKDISQHYDLIQKYLKDLNQLKYLKLIIVLKKLNYCTKQKNQKFILVQGFQQIMAKQEQIKRGDSILKLFLQLQKKTTVQEKICRLESRMFQLYKLICKVKNQNVLKQKQVKRLVLNHNSYPMALAMKALNLYTRQQLKNKKLLMDILSVIKPDIYFIQKTEKLFPELDLQYYYIQEYLKPLLEQAYEQTIYFIYQIVLSIAKQNNFKQNNPLKIRSNTHIFNNQKQKTAQRFMRAIIKQLYILLKPQKNFSCMIQIGLIIFYLTQTYQERPLLAVSIIKWMKQITQMNCTNNDQLYKKFQILKSLWVKIQNFLKKQISFDQLKNTFNAVSKLYINKQTRDPKLQRGLFSFMFMIGNLQFKINTTDENKQAYQIFCIPNHRLKTLIPVKPKFQFNRNIGFLCLKCEKKICKLCANFSHRTHDKNYLKKKYIKCQDHKKKINQIAIDSQTQSNSDTQIIDFTQNSTNNLHNLHNQFFIVGYNYPKRKIPKNQLGSLNFFKTLINQIEQDTIQNNNFKMIKCLQNLQVGKLFRTHLSIVKDIFMIIKHLNFPIKNKILVLSNTKNTVIIINDIITILNLQHLRQYVRTRLKTKLFNYYASKQEYKKFSTSYKFPSQIKKACISKCTPNLLVLGESDGFHVYQLTNQGMNAERKVIVFRNINYEDILKMEFLPQNNNILIIMTTKVIKFFRLDNNQDNKISFICENQYKTFICNKYDISKEIYQLFVCDNQGNLYYERFNLQSSDTINLQIKLHVSSKINVTEILISPFKNIGLITSHQGSNILFKIVNKKIQQITKLNLKRKCPLKSRLYLQLKKLGHIMIYTKLIFLSKKTAIYACCLTKDTSGTSLNGNFAIIKLSEEKYLNIQYSDDNLQTIAFEVISYENLGKRQKFIIIGMYSDGTLWFKIYQPKKKTQKIKIHDQGQINLYNEYINQILKLIKDRGGRCIQFKQYKPLIHQIVMNFSPNTISVTLKTNIFITGITITFFCDPPAIRILKLKFLGNTYQFNLKKQCQIQLPLTIIQSITVFISKKMQISFQNDSGDFKYKGIQVHGIQLQKPSIYLDHYMKLANISIKYLHSNRQTIKKYLTNSLRNDFFYYSYQQITKELLKQAQLTQLTKQDINYIYKLEFACQILDLQKKSIISMTCYQIESYIYQLQNLFFIQTIYIKTSCKRLLKKLFEFYNHKNQNKIILGHPYQYYTYKDLLYINQIYNKFLKYNSRSSFETLLHRLEKILLKRSANIYLIFAIFPNLIRRICYYFKNRANQISRQTILNDQMSIIIKIICEHYHFRINQGNYLRVSNQNIFKLLQLVVFIQKKDISVFKQLLLICVQYLEALPFSPEKKLFYYGCDLLNSDTHLIINNTYKIYQPGINQDQPLQQQKYQGQYQNEMYSMEVQANSQQNNLLNILKITKIQFEYKYIIFQLIIHLSSKKHRIKKQNSNYYITFLYRLVSILNNNIPVYQSLYKQIYINRLLKFLELRLLDGKNPWLFIVFAYFVQPDYKTIETKKEIKRNLRNLIVLQYGSKRSYPVRLFNNQIYPNSGVKQGNLKDALQFRQFSFTTHRFQIKYLSNIYISLLDNGTNIFSPTDNRQLVKKNIIEGFMTSKMRILKNIIIMGKLQPNEYFLLRRGFEQIQNNKIQDGLNTINDIIQNYYKQFHDYVKGQDKLGLLEGLLDKDKNEIKNYSNYLEKLMKLIAVYYENE